jgi:hypothetical protein
MKSKRTEVKSTLAFHREMYERRLERTKRLGGITERQAADKANDPASFRRGPKPETDEEPNKAATG